MSRADESGAYLGGIGTMLARNDLCPHCGQSHPEPLFSLRHGGARTCPKVVVGIFPILTRPADALPSPALTRAHPPAAVGAPSGLSGAVPRKESERRLPTLASRWPIPQETEDYL